MKPTAIVDIAQQYSMTNGKNIMSTISSIQDLDNRAIEGDFVECGVWKGGHVIAALLSAQVNREYWLFDTFNGMTEPGQHDVRRGIHATQTAKYRKNGIENWCRAGVEEVQNNINQHRRAEQQVHYVVGPVEQTLSTHTLPDKIALLRLDTDFYSSTKIELEILWPRLVKGGILIIDDYNSWDGCKLACDEYFGDTVKLTKGKKGTPVKLIK
jgi:hypothetical protein